MSLFSLGKTSGKKPSPTRKSKSTKKPQRSEAGWQRERERAARNRKEKSRTGRDVAPIPPVVDPERKERCRYDFERFLVTYFPLTFDRPWSDDHLKAIRITQEVVLHGGKFAYAMPRGNGKTSIAERAVMWAGLYGHRKYPFPIGANAEAAESIIATIASELENNDLLYADFPEVCHPIRCLEGIANRANAQHCAGKRTLIQWGSDTIVLPTIDGSPASGVVIRSKGIKGAMRGKKVTRPDGKSVRPDFIILDDPQTDESAHSLTQNEKLLRLIRGAVLGMAGPGEQIACLMPCTVICRGDAVDQLLDREQNPDWQGVRTQLIYELPTNEELWEEYRKVRRAGLKAEDKGEAGNQFYTEHREEMRKGARVAWEARKSERDIDALQHAMNLKYDSGDEAFAAEYQNAPLQAQETSEALTAAQIAANTNGRPGGEVPLKCTRVVAFVDVQKTLLYRAVLAVEDDFTGYVLDYGASPDPGREYFACREVKRTLQSELRTDSLEQTIYQGLERYVGELLSTKWTREDGSKVVIDRCLIDANWGESTDVVKKWCRESAYAAQVVPSHGIFVGAASRPFDQYRGKDGDEIGDHWRRPKASGNQVRHVAFDANHWKSFLHARLAVPEGGQGRISLFGSDAQLHRMIADHLTAEEPVPVTAKGRTVTEWKWKPARPDNHLLDCLTGCCVAASMLKISLKEREAPATKPKHRVIANVRFNGTSRGTTQHG